MPTKAKLDEIIDMLWNHPENAEWIPKIEIIPGAAFRQWMASEDIEVLGFVYSMLDDCRLPVDPPLSLDEYLRFVRHYYERCFLENPDGEWSDSRYSAGWDLVNVLAFQWDNADVPKSVMEDWSAGSPISISEGQKTYGLVSSQQLSNICWREAFFENSLPIG